MAILLVACWNIFDSVYTNCLKPLVVHVTNSEDEHDLEHAGHYATCDYITRYGGLYQYDDGVPAQSVRTFVFGDPLMRAPKALSLIAKEF